MAASLAMAGLTACVAQPTEKIIPYVQPPENLVPGTPQFYATAFTLGGYALGVLAESHEGRPTKIEGNPDHPASLGATDIFSQAYLLDLYDPDRSQTITSAGRIRTPAQFFAVLQSALDDQRTKNGIGLRILTETITSPSLAAQIGQVLEKFPQAKWHVYEPVNRDHVYAGATLAFGEPLEPRYHFDRAEVILSLDSDFLFTGPGRVRYARDLSQTRQLDPARPTLSRLYAVGSTPTVTSTKADERFILLPSQMEPFARALAHTLGLDVPLPASLPDGATEWLAALANDLQRHAGSSLILAGEQQPPEIHALAHWMNDYLGNVGQTVEYTAPVVANATNQLASLRELTDAMHAGQVGALLILGGNPVYDAPTDLDFAGALSSVQFTAHLGLHEDETAAACQWHLPQAHLLETWGDARAFDGTITILQPLIQPLYDGKSPHELLAFVLDQPTQTAHDIVKGYWQQQFGDGDFASFWRKSLHDGMVTNTALPTKTAILDAPALQATFAQQPAAPDGSLELLLRPDATLWDGRFANNGWLQELPNPLTKLTWDNAALLAPQTANEMGLTNGDVVTLTLPDRTVDAPIWITPGQMPGCVTVHLGYGRTRVGRVGEGAGFNAYGLRTSDHLWEMSGLEITKTGKSLSLAETQGHFNMEGRDLLRVAPLQEFAANPNFTQEEPAAETSLYPDKAYNGYSWGMVIDLNACIGCNACMIACQAENNIPVVGKEQVLNSREMHWIRVDRYYEGSPDNPDAHFQPVPCMQCENAPCEVVCPVAATTHSAEGLNEMTYNRCVGTRYCANNCPYKVRRFNFLEFSDLDTPVLKLLRNPDVTVRARGVMEKCTYCVQRINAARIDAQKADRLIQDGEIQTACQQVCPAKAIIFGNINDPESEISKHRAQPQHYTLLAELNTRPHTTYLGKVTNPNENLH